MKLKIKNNCNQKLEKNIKSNKVSKKHMKDLRCLYELFLVSIISLSNNLRLNKGKSESRTITCTINVKFSMYSKLKARCDLKLST